jgi:DNA-binding transcriptional MerR regulator
VPGKFYRVSELARLAGVSVRTLHHYDAIGLLKPTRRAANGYRLYSPADALRLQQIVIRRELGMALEQIRRTLDEPAFDLRDALLEQRAALEQRREHTEQMIRSIDAALAVIEEESEDMDTKELFGGFDPAKHEAEAEERWGSTDAWAESKRRTAGYGEDDWTRIKAEADAIHRELADLLRAGAPAEGEAAMDLAERHRLHIDRWFYPCAPAMHRGLGQMYVADERFAAVYEAYEEGLAAYFAAAIEANAARA